MPVTFSPSINPSVGSSGSNTIAVARAQFQEGYEAVTTIGINPVRQKWTLNWNVVSGTEADELLSFFEARGVVEAFYWAPHGYMSPRLFRCTNWSPKIGLTGSSNFTMNAIFEEVFDGSDTFLATASVNFVANPTLPSWLTVSRASESTYQDVNGVMATAAADEPVFEYFGGANSGLRTAPGSTNLVTTSNNFSTWTKTGTGSVTASSGVAPDGTNTAYAILDNDGSNYYEISHGLTVSDNSSAHTVSVFAKNSSQDVIRVTAEFTGGSAVSKWAEFNISSGVVSNPGTAEATFIDAWGNSWKRVGIAVSNNGTGNTTLTIKIRLGDVGTDNGTVLMFGAQAEQQAHMTPYIPTTGSSANRSTEAVSGTLANINVDDAISIRCQFSRRMSTTRDFTVFSLYNITETNSVELIRKSGTTDLTLEVRDSSSVNANPVQPYTDGTTGDLVAAFETGEASLLLSGETVETDNGATVGDMTYFKLGGFGVSTARSSVIYHQELDIYDSKLTAEQMADIL